MVMYLRVTNRVKVSTEKGTTWAHVAVSPMTGTFPLRRVLATLIDTMNCVRVEELGEVRRWVAMHTLLHPAATVPARLQSWILELSLADVRAQVELRATKMGLPLPVHDDTVKERLPYAVLEQGAGYEQGV